MPESGLYQLASMLPGLNGELTAARDILDETLDKPELAAGQNTDKKAALLTMRDQANVVKNLIDETFTNETGIGVNVRLVDMSIRLKASLVGGEAGRGHTGGQHQRHCRGRA